MVFVAKDTSRMSPSEQQAYIDALEDQLAALTEGQDAAAFFNLRKLFGLSPAEAELLLALSDGVMHTKQALVSLLAKGSADQPGMQIINVHLSRIRAKLAGSAIEIHTLWGTGLHVPDTAPLKKAMAGEFVPSTRAEPVVIGRPAGTSGKGHGEVRDAALAFIEAHAVDGVTHVASAAMANACGGATSGAAIIRNLERRGHIEVLREPRRGGLWKLRVVKEDFA